MKKALTLKKALLVAIIAIVICCLFCGCGNQAATLSVTTTGGTAYTTSGYCRANTLFTDNPQHKAVNNPVIFNMETGETAHIKFSCPECGYNFEVEDTAAPYSDFLYCECEKPSYISISLKLVKPDED